MRKILNIILWISLPLGVLVVVVLTQNHYQNKTVVALNVDINYNIEGETNRLLTYEDINTFVRHRYDSIKGKKIKSINIEEIEYDLMDNPYIKSADAYTTMDGSVQLRIIQRKAIVRVIDVFGDQFYMDDQARILPIRSYYPARVLVCNGNVRNIGYYSNNYTHKQLDSLVEISILKDIYQMAKYIEMDTLLSRQIVQLNVDIKGEFVLVPLLSNHIIKFGKAENIAEKFNKLKIFYTDGLGHHRWNDYKTINLKYKNQIVCTKN